MSNTSTRRAQREHTHRTHWWIAAVSTVAIVAVVVFAVTSGGSSSTSTAAARTGETNSMGMPVIATPGAGTGTASAAGLTASPKQWALGRVKLNVAVRPKWQLTNTGTDTITVGQPHVQINKGCCPGALTFDGSTTLTPGQSTNLAFELSMHPGMDGAHDMTLHVPVQHADGTTSTLDLSVTGDFRD
jgi:hypothetical protein